MQALMAWTVDEKGMGKRSGWRLWRWRELAEALDKRILCNPAQDPSSQALSVPIWKMS